MRRQEGAAAARAEGVRAAVEQRGGDVQVPGGLSRRAPGGEIAVAGEAEPVVVKLGGSRTPKRGQDKLSQDQRKLGTDWARPVTVPHAVPDSLRSPSCAVTGPRGSQGPGSGAVCRLAATALRPNR